MAADEAHATTRQRRASRLIIDAPMLGGPPAHRDDLERVRLSIIVFDGDVLALDEAMLVQVIARLLVAGPILVVVDHPGRTARPARPMDQNALTLASSDQKRRTRQ